MSGRPRRTSFRTFAVVVSTVGLLISACQDADEPEAAEAPSPASPLTTSVPATAVPPTTAAPTTTVPPTTAVPTTTVPPTTAVPTTNVPPTTVPPPPRVLLVGDSTLLAVQAYRVERALTGFEPVLEVASCRTLGVPSCGDPPVPANSVETITTATGPFDGVVIMAGYDEWWDTFPTSVQEVLDAARAQGAGWVLWLDYPEGVPYLLPDGRGADEAFVRNNATLDAYAADPANDDLVVTEWGAYSGRAPEWISPDGIHLTPTGAIGVADYISRWVAHLAGRPCPVPSSAGGVIESPCGDPDTLPAPPALADLYAGV